MRMKEKNIIVPHKLQKITKIGQIPTRRSNNGVTGDTRNSATDLSTHIQTNFLYLYLSILTKEMNAAKVPDFPTKKCGQLLIISSVQTLADSRLQESWAAPVLLANASSSFLPFTLTLNYTQLALPRGPAVGNTKMRCNGNNQYPCPKLLASSMSTLVSPNISRTVTLFSPVSTAAWQAR